MTTLANPAEKPTLDSQQIAARLLEALADLSHECKARMTKSHSQPMPVADLRGFQLGISWLDQQRQRESLLTLGHAIVREAPSLIGGHRRKAATLEQLRACLRPILQMLPDVNRPPEHQLEWLFDGLLVDELHCLPSEDVKAVMTRPQYRTQHWQYMVSHLEDSLPRVTRTGLSWQGQQRRCQLLGYLSFAYQKSGWGERVEPLLRKELPLCLCYGQLAEELKRKGELEQAQSLLIDGIKRFHATRPVLADEWMEKLNSLSL